MKPTCFEERRGPLLISNDPSRLHLETIHQFLSTGTYWAQDISVELVRRALENSLCFGVYDGTSQIGLGRIITDYATYAYFTDIYIAPDYRGQGLSKWLVECMLTLPELACMRRVALMTKDAHELYRPFGFTESPNPQWYMEIVRPDVYRKGS